MKHRNPANYGVITLFLGLLCLVSLSSVKAQTEICHPRPMDIVFVIDGSRSVRPWHFKSTTDAVKDMVDNFDTIGPESTQIGLIQYGSVVKQEFALGQYQTKEAVNEAIDGIEYMAGGTMTGAALRYLVTQTFTKQMGARKRPDVAQIAVVITDGRAQDKRAVAVWQKKVKDADIEIFAIGVGRRIDDEDLLLMASEPKDKHKYYVKNFNLIQNLHLLLKDEICVYDPCENSGCEYRCEALEDNGFRCLCPDGFELRRDERTCMATKPANPVSLEFHDITHTSMEVTWSLDEPERISTVEHYIATYRESDGSGELRRMQVTDAEAVLEDLTPGTEYTVTVQAYGDGITSDTLTGSETTLFLGETRVTVSDETLTTFRVSWDPAGGDLLSGYVVEVGLIGEGGEFGQVRRQEVTSDVHEFNFDSLTPGTTYHISVTPMHGKLRGGQGTTTGTTLSLKAPAVLVTDATYTSAVVEWTGIGGKADYFLIRLFRSDSVDGEQEGMLKKVRGDAHSVTYTGLEPGTDYTAIVVGYVGEIDSPEGSAEGRTQSPETPVVQVTDSGFTTMDVFWTMSGKTPDSFEVEWYANGDYINRQTLTTEDLSLSLENLLPGTGYTIDVVAVYGKGIRSGKGSANGVTKSPPAPVVQITDTGMTTLDASWTVDGLQPTNYEISFYQPDGVVKYFTTTDTFMTFDDLIPGTEYEVSVHGVYETNSEIVGDIFSESGTAKDTTKPAPAPEVQVGDTTLTTMLVSWAFDALEAKNFRVVVVNSDGAEVKTFTTSDYSSTITGLEPGMEYSVWVYAVYDAAGSEFETEKGSDSGVTKSLMAPEVDAEVTSWTTASVSWTGIGVPATRWRIEYFYDGAEPVSKEVDGELTTTTLTVESDRYYQVTVTGIVEEGGEIFESPQGSDTFETGTVPGPAVDITSTGLTTAQVSWTPSESGELGKPSGYRVTYFVTDRPGTSQTFTSETTSAELTGLDQGTEYTVEVIALYRDASPGGGNFESSPGTDADTTKSLKAPDVTATVTSPTTTKISWTSDIGFEITSWRIEYRIKGSGEPPLSQETAGDVTTITLEDLERDAEYDVWVYGIAHEDGKTFESPPGTGDFVMNVHSPPSVKIDQTGLQVMYVSWTVEGKYPSQFLGRYYPIGEPDNVQEFTTEDVSYKMTGLDQDTEYTIEVTSVYTEGDITIKTDPGSATDRTKTLRAPEVTTIGSTYTTADIEWTGIGMIPTRWEIQYKRVDSDDEPQNLVVDGDQLTTTLSDLQHGVEYIVIVRGIVEEDGETFTSPDGQDQFRLGDLTPPKVTITDRTTTTISIKWTTNIDADAFIIVIEGEDGYTEEVTVEGDVSTWTFDSLTPGTRYTIRVTTKVIEGEDEILSPPGATEGNTKPGPPDNLQEKSGTPISVIVTFDPPSGGYDYFEAICVPTASSPDDFEPFKVAKAESLHAVCSDLNPDTPYSVMIRTVLGDEVSDWVTVQIFTALGPPLSFKLSEPTTHTILATWRLPARLEVVDSYILSYRPDESDEPPQEVRIPASETSYLIKGLRPSTRYEGSILAIVKSYSSTGAQDWETTLDEEVSITVTETDYNTIDVEWPGSSVPGVTYVISWKASPDFVVSTPGGSVTLKEGTTSTTIEGLVPATIYDITIQYIYPDGEPGEGTTTGSTLAPPPGPLTFTEVTFDEFIVHWGKPGYDAEPIGYIVTYAGPTGEIVTKELEDGDTLSWKFDSLTPGSTYEVTVVAKYQNGIQSDPVKSEVITAPSEQETCSCTDYMRKQNQMQQTVEKLVEVIQALNARIGNLESIVVPPASNCDVEP